MITKTFTCSKILKGRKAAFRLFSRSKIQLVIAAENFDTEEYLWLCPVQILKMSRHMDEQLKIAHKMVENVDRPYRKYVWLCCSTKWTSQRNYMVKFD